MVDNGDFFLPHIFCSSLKDTVLSDEEYENVKKFYKTMKSKNFGGLNKIYSFQDTIILCEIFEQRSSCLQEIFKYNPRKCNSVSSFSGCVHRDKSKCCIALPTDAENVRVFEKTLIGGFSYVNTRLAFHTEILIVDNKNEKVLFDLYIDGKKQTKRISSKILKMDEKNQYEMAMTKPLPYGCIKEKDNPPTFLEFNRILDGLSHENTIGHLFIVDIKFHDINPKTLLINELCPTIFEKYKKMEPFDRSTLSTFKYHGQGWGQGKNKFLPLQLQNTFDIKRKKYILHFMLRICIF